MQDSSTPLNNALMICDSSDDRLRVRLHLEVMGFMVYDCATSEEGLQIFAEHDFSLTFIHLGHSPLKSLEVCRLIRAASNVPIIMCTRRGQVIDEEMVMSAGADDYISMPTNSKILTSRITQQMLRGRSESRPTANLLVWGPLQMNLAEHSFMIGTQQVDLTNMEYQFLQLLMENPKRIFSRNQILEAIGVMKGLGTDHIVDSHASRIRAKIRQSGGPEIISVVRGVGFRLAKVA
jgi:DNA-binding response OmpR family regulator